MEEYHVEDNTYREDESPPDPYHWTAALYDDTPDLYIDIGGNSETYYAMELWLMSRYIDLLQDADASVSMLRGL